MRAKGEISFDRNHSNSLARCFDEEGMLKFARAEAKRNEAAAKGKSSIKIAQEQVESAVSWIGNLKKKVANFIAGEEDEYQDVQKQTAVL